MTCERIDLVNATLNVSGYCLGILRFQQIVDYTPDASCPGGSCTHPPCPTSDPGDSGSPVLDSNNNIVALNSAGDNDGNGFGADINNVLAELGLTLDLTQCAASSFTLLPISPGVANTDNLLQATGATPGGRVGFIFGRQAGSFTLQIVCPGLTFDISNPKFLGTDFADSNGDVAFNLFVPGGASGITAFFQAVDLDACTASNSIQQTF